MGKKVKLAGKDSHVDHHHETIKDGRRTRPGRENVHHGECGFVHVDL